MKTFSRLLSEISQPKSEDELNFKEKHLIDPKDHPVAPDSVFSGAIDKDDIDGMKRYRKNKRFADYQHPEDEDVYEAVTLKRDMPGQEDDDVDNDGDSDMTDAQLRYRRHAQIKKYKIDEAVYVIPEEILATEKNAFHTAAANAHAAGRKHFAFAGKKYPVTMSKDAAKTFAGKGDMNEKVTEPYAIGMAQAMKSTGDKPPLEKKTINLAHKIAKGIKKNEALDPVGQEDDDIDNDDKITKKDKYLHNRRKAISASIRTKIKEGFGAVTAAGGDYDSEESHQRYKKSNSTKKENVTLGDGKGLKVFAGKTRETQIQEEIEQIDEISDKVKASYLDKAVQQRSDRWHEPWDPKKNPKWATPTGKPKKGYSMQPHKIKERDKDDRRAKIIDKTAEKLTGKPHYDKMSTMTTPAVQGNAADWWRGKKYSKEEVEHIDEISKKTLGSYIKKASHDVATKSAATGRYAERSNKEADTRKKTGDMSNYRQGREDDKTADKFFRKSWKRREGIAKATDRLTKESYDLNEAFSAGAVKLNDGSSVLVKAQDAKLLNQLMNDLKPENAKKMLKVAMTDKSGFNEILGFAREAL